MVCSMISQKRVYEIIEKGQADDRASRYCDLLLFALIVLNLLAVCLETIDSLFVKYRTIFMLIELIWLLLIPATIIIRIEDDTSTSGRLNPLPSGFIGLNALVRFIFGLTKKCHLDIVLCPSNGVTANPNSDAKLIFMCLFWFAY